MKNIIKKFEELGYKFTENESFIEFECESNKEKYFRFNKENERITIGYYDISLEELNLIKKVSNELRKNNMIYIKGYGYYIGKFDEHDLNNGTDKAEVEKAKKRNWFTIYKSKSDLQKQETYWDRIICMRYK